MTDPRSHSLKWIPNALTLARCGLSVLVGWFILRAPDGSFLPVTAFVLVALTDFVDGWAARRLGATSALGAFLDPVADKLLVGISLLALSHMQSWHLGLLVPTLAIISRDIIATGLRLFPKIEMPVSQLAKWKTALEMVGIGALLLAGPVTNSQIWQVGLVMVWAAAALSIYTLGLYLGALAPDTKRPR